MRWTSRCSACATTAPARRCIAAFARRFAQLQDPEAGLLPGDALEPVDDVPALEDLGEAGDAERASSTASRSSSSTAGSARRWACAGPSR